MDFLFFALNDDEIKINVWNYINDVFYILFFCIVKYIQWPYTGILTFIHTTGWALTRYPFILNAFEHYERR